MGVYAIWRPREREKGGEGGKRIPLSPFLPLDIVWLTSILQERSDWRSKSGLGERYSASSSISVPMFFRKSEEGLGDGVSFTWKSFSSTL